MGRKLAANGWKECGETSQADLSLNPRPVFSGLLCAQILMAHFLVLGAIKNSFYIAEDEPNANVPLV